MTCFGDVTAGVTAGIKQLYRIPSEIKLRFAPDSDLVIRVEDALTIATSDYEPTW
jgi:hypothetical protein